MTRDQKIVAAGAASGIVSMAVAMWMLSTLLPPPGPKSLAGALAYAARWLAFAALPLFAMIAAVGNARFLGEAIDPTRSAEDRTMIVNGRVADNTTQQSFQHSGIRSLEFT